MGLALVVWVGWGQRERFMKTLAAFIVPGLALAGVLCGWTLSSWTKGQFIWGAKSLRKMGESVLDASLFQPNQFLLPPHLLRLFQNIGPYLFPALGVCFAWRIAALALDRAALRDDTARLRAALAAVCTATLFVELCAHQAMYSALRILLPLGRTALFIAPTVFLAAGAMAAVPLPSRFGRASGAALTAALAAIAVYSTGCLRLNYFQEWMFGADSKNVYSVLAFYNRKYGVTEVSSDWRYGSSLNFYRETSVLSTLREIGPGPADASNFPVGFPIYVLYYPLENEIIARENLKIVYRDWLTDATIAVRPDVESKLSCGQAN